jgi:hypothetical protein
MPSPRVLDHHTLLCSLFMMGLMSPFAGSQEIDEQDLQFFETKIRPVLVEHCYECHSAEAAERGKLRGGLRLDSPAATLRGGDSGPALEVHKPDESLLIAALKYEDFEMPPSGKLSDTTISDFEKWIKDGAVDPRTSTSEPVPTKIDIDAGRAFWSFQPLDRSPPPEGTAWSKNRIDSYIEARFRAQGLHGNDTAAPRVLIRRAWFDLLGLPPTPDEMQIWTDRLSAGASREAPINRAAYSQMLDELLDRPQYGERWARHWMDVARFAESFGYEQDYNRPNAYHYRDFLIQAFNQDLPFDQFVQWQLAGDELAPQNPLALMATGFLGAGAFPTQLTEAEFESARYDELDDIVSTTGVAFLGLSLGCARCHDHKYDPITAEDYYRFAANFTTTIRSELQLDLNPDENRAKREAYETELKALQAQLKTFEAERLPSAFRQWLSETPLDATTASPWSVLSGPLASSANTTFTLQSDGSYLATGKAPAGEVLTFEADLSLAPMTAFRLEALADPSLPRGGPGRAPNGNFALGDIRVFRIPKDSPSTPARLKLSRAKATHEQNNHSLSVAASLDDDRVSGWAVDGQIGKSQAAVFWLENPSSLKPGDRLRVELELNHPNSQHTIGRLRFAVSQLDEPPVEVGGEGIPALVREAIEAQVAKLDEQAPSWDVAIDWFRTTQPEWTKVRQALDQKISEGPPQTLATVMVCSEGLPHLSHHADGRGFPHFYPETHLLRRGDPEQKVKVVEAGFVSVLVPPDQKESHWQLSPPSEDWRTSYRRASLAQWLTDVEQGAGALVARVAANRLWQHHFGRGIVATPNDFGEAGDRPTHPQLLDALASELIQQDWRLKPLHKQIMMSQTYMQSTEFDEQRSKLDPDNHTWWRRVPRRLEAEAIRDSMLAVSDTLDPRMYGPGSLDMNMNRRSVYFMIKRSELIPTMMLFDWPEHLVSIGRRSTTTIAPQALMFMNSPQGRRVSESLLNQVSEWEGEARLQQLLLRSYGRAPSAREASILLAFIDRQAASYSNAQVNAPEQRAWVDLCQTLLSSSEFIYID